MKGMSMRKGGEHTVAFVTNIGILKSMIISGHTELLGISKCEHECVFFVLWDSQWKGNATFSSLMLGEIPTQFFPLRTW